MAGAPPPTTGGAGARALQDALAAQVESRDRFATPLRTIAAFAVTPGTGSVATRAGAVLIDLDSGGRARARGVQAQADRRRSTA